MVIGVVAAGDRPALAPGEPAAHGGGGGALLQHAALGLAMAPRLGDGSVLGQREPADVLIVGDQSAAVRVNLAAPSGGPVLDGRGRSVLPGCVEPHDHLWQSLIRGCAADAARTDWLSRCTVPRRTPPCSAADAYAGVCLSPAGGLETGVTPVVDGSAPFGTPCMCGPVGALTDSQMRCAFAMLGSASNGAERGRSWYATEAGRPRQAVGAPRL